MCLRLELKVLLSAIFRKTYTQACCEVFYRNRRGFWGRGFSLIVGNCLKDKLSGIQSRALRTACCQQSLTQVHLQEDSLGTYCVHGTDLSSG